MRMLVDVSSFFFGDFVYVVLLMPFVEVGKNVPQHVGNLVRVVDSSVDLISARKVPVFTNYESFT